MAQVWLSCLAIGAALAFTLHQAVADPSYRPVPNFTARADPYKNFKFRLKMDGRAVAGFAKAAGLHASARGASPAGTITLQQGITHDVAFEAWASAALRRRRDARDQGAAKDVAIEALNEAGQVSRTYLVSQTRVSLYQGAPDLDANANQVTIEVVRLEHEGWKIQ